MNTVEEYFEIDTNPSKHPHEPDVIEVHLKLKNMTPEKATFKWALEIPAVYEETTNNPLSGTDDLTAYSQKPIIGWKISLTKIAESQRKTVVDRNPMRFMFTLNVGGVWMPFPHQQRLM